MTETKSFYEMVQQHKKAIELEADASEKLRKIDEALLIVIAQVELLAEMNPGWRANELWSQTQSLIENARNDHL